MKIELWDLGSEYLGLIIPADTGISYTNQVGGTYCGHPVVEGFYVPLPTGWLVAEANEFIRDFFFNNPTQAEVDAHCGKFLSAGDGFLEAYFDVPTAQVPFMAEAWMPVLVKENKSFLTTHQVAGHIGYLTWSNSD